MRDDRRAPFCWQDVRSLAHIRAHVDRKHRKTALAIYVTMTELANEQRSDTFTAARATIAERSGSSDRTVDEFADQFIRLGLLKKEERRRAGKSLTNVWTLQSPPEGEAVSPHGEASSPHEGEAISQSGGETVSPDSRSTSGTNSETSVKKKKEEDEQAVFGHWLILCEENGYNLRSKELTPSRRRLIASGLKEATVEECCAALTGLFLSDWYMQKGYYELSYCFGWSPQNKKSLRERLDQFISDAERHGKGVRRVTSDQEGTLSRAKDAVRSMYAYPGNGTAQERGRKAVEWLQQHAMEVVAPASADDLPTFREAR